MSAPRSPLCPVAEVPVEPEAEELQAWRRGAVHFRLEVAVLAAEAVGATPSAALAMTPDELATVAYAAGELRAVAEAIEARGLLRHAPRRLAS